MQFSDTKGCELFPRVGRRYRGFSFLFLVSETPDPNNLEQSVRNYITISFETIKDIKQACAQYGPTTPFTLRAMYHRFFRFRVLGSWGTLCLSVPDRLTHFSGSEASRPLCASLPVSLKVKEAWRLGR